MAELIKRCFVLFFLTALTRKDIRERLLSLPILVSFGIVGIFFLMGVEGGLYALQGNAENGYLQNLAGRICPGVISLLCARMSRGGFGMGDGWVILILGIYLGFGSTVYLLMLAFLCAFVFSLFYLIRTRCDKKQELPFVPFLLMGYLLMLVQL